MAVELTRPGSDTVLTVDDAHVDYWRERGFQLVKPKKPAATAKKAADSGKS